MDSVNWSEVTAILTGFSIVIGGIMKILFTKIDANTDKKLLILEKQFQHQFDKLDAKHKEDKAQTFNSINGVGERVQKLETQIALQQQTDSKHDDQIKELSDNHKEIQKEIQDVVNKIWDELRDIRKFFSTLVRPE